MQPPFGFGDCHSHTMSPDDRSSAETRLFKPTKTNSSILISFLLAACASLLSCSCLSRWHFASVPHMACPIYLCGLFLLRKLISRGSLGRRPLSMPVVRDTLE